MLDRRPNMHTRTTQGQAIATSRLPGYAFALMAATAWSAPASIALRGKAQIDAATRVDHGITEMSRAVSTCAASSPQPALCVCRFPEKLHRLQSSYAAAVRQFPAWRGRTVTWEDATTRHTIVVSFDGLERQLQARCP